MADRILLVDDNQDYCEVLGATMKELGYDATFTTSPARRSSVWGRRSPPFSPTWECPTWTASSCALGSSGHGPTYRSSW